MLKKIVDFFHRDVREQAFRNDFLKKTIVFNAAYLPRFSSVGVAQTAFLVNRVFVAYQKGAVLTRTAKRTNLHSTH